MPVSFLIDFRVLTSWSPYLPNRTNVRFWPWVQPIDARAVGAQLIRSPSAGAGQRQSRAEGHHLVAEPCRRICVRDDGGCLAGSIIKPMVESMGLSWQQG